METTMLETPLNKGKTGSFTKQLVCSTEQINLFPHRLLTAGWTQFPCYHCGFGIRGLTAHSPNRVQPALSPPSTADRSLWASPIGFGRWGELVNW